MSAFRGIIFILLAISLTGCNTIFGNLWPTIPKEFDAARESSGHNDACNTFGNLYGTEEPLTHFVSTLVSGKRYQEKSEIDSRKDSGQEVISQHLTQEEIGEHFNGFLDCYLIDLSSYKITKGMEPTEAEKELQKELYALRGHAIVTALARYAAYNLTGRIGGGLHTTPFPPYEDQASDASSILTRIEYAERLIRRESNAAPQFEDDIKPQVEKTANSLGAYPSVRRTNRVFSVVQLAFEAERPSMRRSVNFMTSFWGFISGRSVTDLKNVVGQAIAGIEKAALLGNYSRAYQFDADEILKGINGAPTDKDWKKVDDALRDACDHLATIGGAVPHCLPPEPAKEKEGEGPATQT